MSYRVIGYGNRPSQHFAVDESEERHALQALIQFVTAITNTGYDDEGDAINFSCNNTIHRKDALAIADAVERIVLQQGKPTHQHFDAKEVKFLVDLRNAATAVIETRAKSTVKDGKGVPGVPASMVGDLRDAINKAVENINHLVIPDITLNNRSVNTRTVKALVDFIRKVPAGVAILKIGG